MSEERENTFLIESNKWKRFEEYVLLMINNSKSDCKREEELIKTLEKKIDSLNHSKSDLTERVKSEVYNKYFSTNDIYKLGGVSDQINVFCDDVKGLLETCNKLQQKCKSNLEKCRDKLHQQKHANEDMLKSQNNNITNLKKDIKKSTEVLMTEQEKQSLELNHMRKFQEETANNLKLLLESNQQLENNTMYESETTALENDKYKINEAINEKNQLKDSILASTSDLEKKTNQEIEVLDEKINTMLKKYEEVNFTTEECKKLIEEQENSNDYLFQEIIKLEFDSKLHQEKSSDFEKCIIEEESKFLQNSTELKNYIDGVNSDIQNKEETLLKEKETENACSHAEENYRNNLEKDTKNLNNLQSNLDNLNKIKNNLIESINKENELIETYSKANEQNNTYIQNLKSSIQKLNDTISCSALERENTTVKLIKEVEYCKSNIDARNKELKAAKLKHHAEIDIAQSDEIINFNTEMKILESDLDEARKFNEKMEDQKKQTLINLESRTLECDILSKKIKTAEGVQNSLKEELKPRPIMKSMFQKKRHIDETSESSFDGNVTFHQRMMMKKKTKRNKTPPKKLI